MIANTVISPSQEAKYLGIIFDKQLRFKLHLQHATKKGSKFAHAMSRIAKALGAPVISKLEGFSTQLLRQE
jgi:hypothetical protein